MASVAPVNRVTNSRTQRLVWRVGDILLAPYRKLRPPPEESVVYQLVYLACFTLGAVDGHDQERPLSAADSIKRGSASYTRTTRTRT